jgi:hypothetical protein
MKARVLRAPGVRKRSLRSVSAGTRPRAVRTRERDGVNGAAAPRVSEGEA